MPSDTAAPDQGGGTGVVELPRLQNLARHSLPYLFEAALMPLVVFYAALWIFDEFWALFGAVGWSYAALGRRLAGRRRVGGVLVIAAASLTVRAVFSLAAGSLTVYFLQPTIVQFGVTALFLASVAAGRPIVQLLASDFVDLPTEFTERPAVQRCFARLTVLWALVLAGQALAALWLLLSQTVGVYVIANAVLNYGTKGAAILVSVAMFRRALHRGGLAVRFA